MTDATELWLAPMLRAVKTSRGAHALTRLMESALIGRGLDWIQFGQVLREELGWHHYPALPQQHIENVNRIP